MDLSDSYFIKPIDNEFVLEDWLVNYLFFFNFVFLRYEFILEKCRILRSAKLGRSVFREEYFEVFEF